MRDRATFIFFGLLIAVVLIVLWLMPAEAFGDTLLKDEGTVVGPVLSLNCAGGDAGIACSRSGSTGTITVP